MSAIKTLSLAAVMSSPHEFLIERGPSLERTPRSSSDSTLMLTSRFISNAQFFVYIIQLKVFLPTS
jgi:hypothetical protein